MSLILEGGSVGKRKKILTKKQALGKKVGSYYHPKKDKWRSGACPLGKELKKGYYKKSYKLKKGATVKSTYVDPVCVKVKGMKGKEVKNNSYVEKDVRREILTEKKALKKPVGNFYHPTKETYRTGACPKGKVLKKGYEMKSSKGDVSYVGPVCIKNKGKPGIEVTKNKREEKSKDKGKGRMDKSKKEMKSKDKKGMKLKDSNEKGKINNLIEEVKKDGYKSVVMKLSSKIKKSNNEQNKKKMENKLELLREWRKNHPNNKNKENVKKDKIKKNNTEDKFLNKLEELENEIMNNINNTNNFKNINNIKSLNNMMNNNIIMKKNKNNNKNSNKNKKKNNIKEFTNKNIIELIKNS